MFIYLNTHVRCSFAIQRDFRRLAVAAASPSQLCVWLFETLKPWHMLDQTSQPAMYCINSSRSKVYAYLPCSLHFSNLKELKKMGLVAAAAAAAPSSSASSSGEVAGLHGLVILGHVSGYNLLRCCFEAFCNSGACNFVRFCDSRVTRLNLSGGISAVQVKVEPKAKGWQQQHQQWWGGLQSPQLNVRFKFHHLCVFVPNRCAVCR